MAVPKSKETRVGWLVTNVMERPPLHLFDAAHHFILVAKHNVAGMLHYISNEPTYPCFLFGTATPTSLNNVVYIFRIMATTIL